MNQKNPQSQQDNKKLIKPFIRFENVCVSYGGGDKKKDDKTMALDNVSLSLNRGGVYYLTGPSGAGKSTLLKLMYLALRPTSGTVEIFGKNIENLKRNELPELRREIGVVFQDFRLLPHLNLFDNLALPFRVRGKKIDEYSDDVIDLLGWVGLANKANKLPETLSGGEQQRVAIARAVICKPRLLIADEPTGNVDPQMGDLLIDLMMKLNLYRGSTIVIATHDHEMVRRADKPVLVVDSGRLRQYPSFPSDLKFFGRAK
jgi:cell division transport system ATP-binding protein